MFNKLILLIAEKIAERIAEQIAKEIPKIVDNVGKTIMDDISGVSQTICRTIVSETADTVKGLPREFSDALLRIFKGR